MINFYNSKYFHFSALVVKKQDIMKELDIIKSWKENELKNSKTVADDDNDESEDDSENKMHDKRFFSSISK